MTSEHISSLQTNKLPIIHETIEWDEALLEKYNISGPRYTSYPTALEFSEEYQKDSYTSCLSTLSKDKSLSLYIHIPFCQNICYYCACNKIITKDKSKSERYVNYLLKEIELVAKTLDNNPLRQIHWGGGTPTYLSIEQIERLMEMIKQSFNLVQDSSTEISIEIDPRALAIEDVKHLAKMGFNRMSLGVQDFDLRVQKAINRIQSFEMTKDMIDEARKYGFESINLDLIYGLPLQNTQSFKETLDKVMQISPDRISVFNYAHLPHRFKPQRRIDAKFLPSAAEKLEVFQTIISELQQQGYVYIGMDHFAKPNDELAVLQEKGQLHRNFQGYTTHKEYDLIGVGVSSIGSINDHYHQNVKDIEPYYEALDKNELPIWRGVTVNEDDLIRKKVIFDLICHFKTNKNVINQEFNIDFDTYFAKEIELLKPFIEDELVCITPDSIQVKAKGRLLIRNICMTFDAYLNELQMLNNFSKVI